MYVLMFIKLMYIKLMYQYMCACSCIPSFAWQSWARVNVHTSPKTMLEVCIYA